MEKTMEFYNKSFILGLLITFFSLNLDSMENGNQNTKAVPTLLEIATYNVVQFTSTDSIIYDVTLLPEEVNQKIDLIAIASKLISELNIKFPNKSEFIDILIRKVLFNHKNIKDKLKSLESFVSSLNNSDNSRPESNELFLQFLAEDIDKEATCDIEINNFQSLRKKLKSLQE